MHLFTHRSLQATHPHSAFPFSPQTIQALITCHADHPWAKFWGACNEQKWALDRCFRAEKAIKRKKNLEKARREQERLRARLAAKEQASAAAAT